MPTVAIGDSIKEYLLFCHGLVIEDPLVYLLDYFRGDEDHFSRERIPRVKAVLRQYAEVAPLIRTNVVFPIAGAPILRNNLKSIPHEWVEQIAVRLPKLETSSIQAICYKIQEERHALANLKNRADHFFPAPEYVLVLNEILSLESATYRRNDLGRPYGMSILGKMSTIDPNSVSIEDLINIRMHDDVLAEWRDFLDKTFNELRRDEGYYSDYQGEYLAMADAKFKEWDEKLSKKLSGGALKSGLIKATKDISFGTASGAVIGAATAAVFGTSGLLIGAAGGAMKTGIDKAKELVFSNKKSDEIKAVRHHFMALGVRQK